MPLSPEDLDYLQRTAYVPPRIESRGRTTVAPPDLRSMFRIRGVGRLDKATRSRPADADPPRLITEDLITGLYNDRTHLAYILRGSPGSVSVEVGTWLPGGTPGELAESRRILAAGLAGLYPSIDLVEATPDIPKAPRGAMALGIPSVKAPDSSDGALPIDRLIRALSGLTWVAAILAQPIEEAAIRDLRLRVINEMRSAQTDVRSAGVPSPLAEHYSSLLEKLMLALTEGQAIGAWRTAVYLLSDEDSHLALSGTWRGIFAGARSLPEPIRVWSRDDVVDVATAWALPDPTADDSDRQRRYEHPFDHQTLLTSAQLAAYVHLPELETGGFSVTIVPDFDAVPPDSGTTGFHVGEVLERGRPTSRGYAIKPKSLTRHAFVTGVTGAGKTNTIFHLLDQTTALDVPFLVVEPTKTEYRALLGHETLKDALQVFTLGDERTSPFRLNPFEFPVGIPVGVHIDLLRSVFSVSFGMWTPLPQVLELCLYEVYEDRGWEVGFDTNRRVTDLAHRDASFPTLTDMVRKVEDVAGRLGYEERITSDIRAALRTRFNSIRMGAKGRLLDVRWSVPFDVLLGRPTVLELEAMGDDDDKALVMGLVMIRLAEERRIRGQADGLIHLLVIEEAHRLLGAAPAQVDEAQANARGKAVETFVNLISEVRAYGQGIVIADQVPSRLAPDVIKNTNLKIVHRIVAADDRSVLAGAMAMNERQERSLATLTVGQGPTFADGDDAPVLVQVPLAKGSGATVPDGAHVHEAMTKLPHLQALAPLFLPSYDCEGACRMAPDACEAARAVVDDAAFRRTFARMVHSTVEDPTAFERLVPDVEAAVHVLRPPWVDGAPLMASLAVHAARDFASRRGAQGGWTYLDTDRFGGALRDVLLAARTAARDAIEQFRSVALPLLGPGFGPYAACRRLWADQDHPCRCRSSVSELVDGGAFAPAWREAVAGDRNDPDGRRVRSWGVCQDAAYQLIEFPDPGSGAYAQDGVAAVARRVALCFGQQVIARDPATHPETARRMIEGVIQEAGHG